MYAQWAFQATYYFAMKVLPLLSGGMATALAQFSWPSSVYSSVLGPASHRLMMLAWAAACLDTDIVVHEFENEIPEPSSLPESASQRYEKSSELAHRPMSYRPPLSTPTRQRLLRIQQWLPPGLLGPYEIKGKCLQ